MKHNVKIISIMICMFFMAQVIGLLVTNSYIDVEKTIETGKVHFRDMELSGVTIERPQVNETYSFAYMMVAIIIGTLIIFALMKWRKEIIWKLWFFIAVCLCLSIAFAAFIDSTVALIIGMALSYYKIFKPNIIVHNLTELFVYAGLAVIFVPIVDMFSAFMLLFLISLYDMYAVWQSKHMIKMAKFQTKSKIFAGMLVPYGKISLKKSKKKKGKSTRMVKVNTAILGGGDIGFPLIFSGAVLKTYGFGYSMFIPPFATLALFGLFYFGKQKKFYPAMPFISLGCIMGYLLLFVARSLGF